jgi:hypothetical protein
MNARIASLVLFASSSSLLGCPTAEGADAGVDAARADTSSADAWSAVDAPMLADAWAPDAPLPDAASDAARPLTCSPLAYEGSAAWTGRLTVEPGAALCAYWPREVVFSLPDDFETPVRDALRLALMRKSELRISAGAYALPTTSASSRLALPMCLSDEGAASLPVQAASAVTVARVEGDFSRRDGNYVRASFPVGASTIEFELGLDFATSRATLSAGPAMSHLDITAMRDNRLYASCSLRATQCWSLAFPGLATVQLDEHTWRSSPGLGFAAASHLAGMVRSTTVDIRDYSDITTVYGHHAFDRYSFFRLATPIEGACGIRIDASVDETWRAVLAACDGTPMGAAVVGTAMMRTCE